MVSNGLEVEIIGGLAGIEFNIIFNVPTVIVLETVITVNKLKKIIPKSSKNLIKPTEFKIQKEHFASNCKKPHSPEVQVAQKP